MKTPLALCTTLETLKQPTLKTLPLLRHTLTLKKKLKRKKILQLLKYTLKLKFEHGVRL